MKIPSILLLGIPTALADFWMVYQRRYAQFGRAEVSSFGTSFVADVDAAWTCDQDAFRHRILRDERNASRRPGPGPGPGQGYSVRFSPWNDRPGPLWHDPLVMVDVDVFSSSIPGRQTIVRNRNATDGFTMVNGHGNVTGQCHENRTFIIDLDCWYRHPDPRVTQYHVNINGSSMFFCESDIVIDGVGDGPDANDTDEDTVKRDAWAAGFMID
ncbi:hypothetical protein GGR50DRAFT_52197 [Xylaria sp. CBS 124048]|nr:hypothetical protein GGR50DRAFT_52197 [Xylaria sp. CBS 124048]